MQRDIFQTIPGFDLLLETQSFNELSPADKEKVLQWMTAEEYTQYRNSFYLLKKEITSVQKIHPDPDTKRVLMQAFDKKYGKKKTASGLLLIALNYKLPVYQTGLAAALIFAFLWFGNPSVDKLKYVHPIDTVYVEKPAYAFKPDHSAEETITNYQAVKQVKKRWINKKKTIRPNYYIASLTYPIISKMQSMRQIKCGQSVDKDTVLMAWISPAR